MADSAAYKPMSSENGSTMGNHTLDKNQNVDSKPSDDTIKLERHMGLFSGITIIVGNIIGSGIFLTPSTVLKNAGSVGMSLVVWSGAGVFSLLGALCFLELGTTITKSGAEYIYIKQIFGDLPAFMVLWVTMVIVAPVSRILTCFTFANYILQPFYGDSGCGAPYEVVAILSVACISKYQYLIKLIPDDGFSFIDLFVNVFATI